MQAFQVGACGSVAAMTQEVPDHAKLGVQVLHSSRKGMPRAMHFGRSKILQTHACYRPIPYRLSLAVIGAREPHRISGFPPSGVGNLQVLEDRLRHEQINVIVHDFATLAALPGNGNSSAGQENITTCEVFHLAYTPASVEQQ